LGQNGQRDRDRDERRHPDQHGGPRRPCVSDGKDVHDLGAARREQAGEQEWPDAPLPVPRDECADAGRDERDKQGREGAGLGARGGGEGRGAARGTAGRGARRRTGRGPARGGRAPRGGGGGGGGGGAGGPPALKARPTAPTESDPTLRGGGGSQGNRRVTRVE